MIQTKNYILTNRGVLVILLILFFTLIISVIFTVGSLENNVSCNLDLEYLDVSDSASCYGPFSSHYCPVPKHVDCDFSGNLIGNLIISNAIDEVVNKI